ncbi:hypothetical protein ACFOOK_31175 [Micromonospora krabiensis]|uniref:Uncharacterized protein n=1 Tax=Micromonospora krabiensis TaxID=307121 RepID=A0A1C3N3G2_9ACTN|nr:hypothetical protein [Micromonospora krabiensis]SBV27086.1 hypothetical protein GA0070620_2593 [Micromonospora krabiensis]
MVIVWRYALRLAAVVVCLTGVELALAGRAQAAFATQLSGLPERFTGGDQVRTVSAVVSRTDRGGCVKVRWSLVVTVEGIRLDQVRLDRVEETGSFPLDIRTSGDVARLTDRQLDPGALCPNRTVTARYRLAFAENIGTGRVTLAAEAYDAGLRLLARQTATRAVVGAEAPATGPAPRPTPTRPQPTEPASVEEEVTPPGPDATFDEPAAGVPVAGAGRPVSAAGGFGVVQAGFLMGGLLVFLGVGLLLRMRHLTRATDPAPGGEVPPVGAGWETPARRDRRRSARW